MPVLAVTDTFRSVVLTGASRFFRISRQRDLNGFLKSKSSKTSKQLIVETRAPIPAKPGRKARHDYEYERNGVANLFMVFAPLEGWRHVKVSDRHTAIDYAHTLRDLSDVHFPDAAKIVLVQDNLNTHKPASLYEAFPAPEKTLAPTAPTTALR
jgi:DDE superfamily endonuclease